MGGPRERPEDGAPGIDRRSVLRAGAFGAAGLASARFLAGCSTMPSAAPVVPPVTIPPDAVYDCGVASGLHAPDAAVLWTRVAPGAVAAVDVAWEVAIDPGFTSVVATGTASAEPGADGCVKVLAQGLSPATTHWYRFRVDGRTSPVGRTRTPAGEGAPVPRVRLGVASCQNFPAGFYPAWRAMAAEDLDAVVHVGDYIYESGGGSANPLNVRFDELGTATTLAGYRAKYRLYRSDADLRAAHAAHAFLPVWDDHEFVNDYDRLTIVEQPARAEAAYRAWFEYQPVWPIDGTRIHRRARFGSLVDLSLLDTRQYRDPHPNGGKGTLSATTDGPAREVHREGRTIMGDDQRTWLLDGFDDAQDRGITWKLVGNQVMIAPVRIVDLDEPFLRLFNPDTPKHAGVYLNTDSWDGYQWERDEVMRHLHDGGVANVGFLTGDIHAFWQAPLLVDFDDDASPAVAQEFVCGSVSSRGLDYAGDLAAGLSEAAVGLRPGFRYVDLVRRGFGIIDCTSGSATVEFRVADASRPDGVVRPASRFDWAAGTQDVRLVPA